MHVRISDTHVICLDKIPDTHVIIPCQSPWYTRYYSLWRKRKKRLIASISVISPSSHHFRYFFWLSSNWKREGEKKVSNLTKPIWLRQTLKLFIFCREVSFRVKKRKFNYPWDCCHIRFHLALKFASNRHND